MAEDGWKSVCPPGALARDRVILVRGRRRQDKGGRDGRTQFLGPREGGSRLARVEEAFGEDLSKGGIWTCEGLGRPLRWRQKASL